MALIGAQRGNDDIRPKQRAVLAYAPALVLEATAIGGALEFFLRPVAVDSLLWLEACKRLADKLLGAIALDPLRTGVPADDDAIWVEQKDCMVLDVRYQLGEMLFDFREIVG